jgi:hypothetical protein
MDGMYNTSRYVELSEGTRFPTPLFTCGNASCTHQTPTSRDLLYKQLIDGSRKPSITPDLLGSVFSWRYLRKEWKEMRIYNFFF